MSDYYLICRSWMYFDHYSPFQDHLYPPFPFYDDLNHLHDEKILPELNNLCVEHFRKNKAWFKKEYRRRKKELREKIEKRQQSFGESKRYPTRRNSHATKTTLNAAIMENIRGPRSNSAACKIAKIARWKSFSNQAEFGQLSPSRMLVVMKDTQSIVEVVEERLREQFKEYRDFTFKFFSLPVSNFTQLQQNKLEVRRESNIRMWETTKHGNNDKLINESKLHGWVVEQSVETMEIARKVAAESGQVAFPDIKSTPAPNISVKHSENRYKYEPTPLNNRLKKIAIRADELLQGGDHVIERFRRIILDCDEAAKQVGKEQRGLVGRLPTRALSLPERYSWVAAIHDTFCEDVEPINPYNTILQQVTQTEGVRMLKAMVYSIRMAQVQSLTDDEVGRMEEALTVVADDLGIKLHQTLPPVTDEQTHKSKTPDPIQPASTPAMPDLAAESNQTVQPVPTEQAVKPTDKNESIPPLQPSKEKAYQTWKFAESKMEPPPENDKATYLWLQENFDESEGYRLPAFETWVRYVTAGRAHHGEEKYQGKKTRRTTRTVFPQSGINASDIHNIKE